MLARYRGLTALGIPLTGILWSSGVFFGRAGQIEALDVSPAQAFLLVAIGGVSQTVALWFGLAAVTWAMIRVLGARVAFVRLLALLSTASLGLWAGAPAAGFYLSSEGPARPAAALIALAGVAASLVIAADGIREATGWTNTRAWCAIVFTAVFVASFASLSL